MGFIVLLGKKSYDYFCELMCRNTRRILKNKGYPEFETFEIFWLRKESGEFLEQFLPHRDHLIVIPGVNEYDVGSIARVLNRANKAIAEDRINNHECN